MVKLNERMEAGTDAAIPTTAEVNYVSQTIAKPLVSGWVSVNDRLPEPLQTVWISNGKGWTSLGCRTELYEIDGVWNWCWAETNGTIYEQDGQIVTEAEEDDLDVQYWHECPAPPCR